MAEILFDNGDFQSLNDFETGEPLDNENAGSLMKEIMRLTPGLPFPGDLDEASVKWTLDCSLAINKLIHPDFMFISFATPMMLRTNYQLSEQENKALNKKVFDAVEEFFSAANFLPFIVGGGDMSPVKGKLDFSSLSRTPTHSFCNHYLAGLFHADKNDGERLGDIPNIRKIISKEEYLKANPGLSEEYHAMLPDYHIMRNNGYAFDTITKRGYTLANVADIMEELPVYTPFCRPRHIREAAPLINKALDEGKRVALVLLEAIGFENFALPYQRVNNQDDFFCYDQGLSLYFTLNSGKTYSEQAYPPVVSTTVALNTNKKYPYSQQFAVLPSDTIGQRKDKITAAVGTRSGFIHECSMADVCLECHSRNLSESGIFVLTGEKK